MMALSRKRERDLTILVDVILQPGRDSRIGSAEIARRLGYKVQNDVHPLVNVARNRGILVGAVKGGRGHEAGYYLIETLSEFMESVDYLEEHITGTKATIRSMFKAAKEKFK